MNFSSKKVEAKKIRQKAEKNLQTEARRVARACRDIGRLSLEMVKIIVLMLFAQRNDNQLLIIIIIKMVTMANLMLCFNV